MNQVVPFMSIEQPFSDGEVRFSKEMAEQDSDVLYARIMYELGRRGLSENEQILRALYDALDLHKDQQRTDGPYVNHIMKVGLGIMVDLQINDPDIIAAAFYHDSPEDHARRIIERLSPSRQTGDDRADAIAALYEKQYFSDRTTGTVARVTCPVFDGPDKNERYYEYVVTEIMPDPPARVVKLSDFLRNAVENHNSKEPLRTRLDLKYLPLYDIHQAALYLPDSLVPEDVRADIHRRILEGKERALVRIANAGMMGRLSIKASGSGISVVNT